MIREFQRRHHQQDTPQIWVLWSTSTIGKYVFFYATARCNGWIDKHTFDRLQQPITAERHKWRRFRVRLQMNLYYSPTFPLKGGAVKRLSGLWLQLQFQICAAAGNPWTFHCSFKRLTAIFSTKYQVPGTNYHLQHPAPSISGHAFLQYPPVFPDVCVFTPPPPFTHM